VNEATKKQIESCLKELREHTDKFYDLVRKADESKPTWDPVNKDKHMAGWHGHEINKNIRMIYSWLEKAYEPSNHS
jgi:hypothetical protein